MKVLCYSDAALEQIDAAIAPCLPGRSRAEMLDHIGQAALDYVNLMTHSFSTAKIRNQLRELARALTEASRRMDALDSPSELCFTLAAQRAGLPRRVVGQRMEAQHLADLANVARDAAEMPAVKSGPTTNESLAHFIRTLARIVERWTGEPVRSRSYSDYDKTYGGPFFGLVRACIAPLGTDDANKTDAALGKAIQRALASRDKSAPIRPLICPLYMEHPM